MQLNAYLNFNGQCAEAFRFYAECFGGTITTMMTFGESPMAGHGPADLILHATLLIPGTPCDQSLAGSDATPERYRQPQGFSVQMNLADIATTERIFAALAQGGEVSLPLQETFWTPRFGMVTDRFGIPWILNCEASKTS